MIAKATAAVSAAAKAVPKIRAGCPLGGASWSIPVSRHHARLNSGPYQSPPSRKADSAAASTASQLMSTGTAIFKLPRVQPRPGLSRDAGVRFRLRYRGSAG